MKSISEILKNAREDFIIGKYGCMCVAISRNCEGNNVGEQREWMKHNIALFNRKIAIEKFNAFDQGMYWWRRWDNKNRLNYFDWLIEQYK